MFENVKTDIIYFKSNTDFELEFNLCGCCKMRLLTAKTSDKKTFVHSLARAVSRSQVVMIIGSLFSDEGIINLTANAIGSTLVTVNNSEYGIESDQNIEIIKNSLPLVTPEGYFGGCIIESGPQTIILLSESKNIRKTIMSDLIHPYIQDLSSNNGDAQDMEETDMKENTPEELIEETIQKTSEKIEEETVTEEKTEIIENEGVPESITKETVSEEPKEKEDAATVGTTEEVEEKNETITNDDFFFFGVAPTDANTTPTDLTPVPVMDTSIPERKSGIFGIFSKKNTQTAFSFDEEEIGDTNTLEDTNELEETNDLEETNNIEETNDIKDTNDFEDTIDFEDTDDFEDPIGIIDNFEPQEDAMPFFPKKKSGLKISMLILMIVVLLAIAVLCYSLFYVPAQSGTTAADNIQEIMNALFG